ncbi:hypothetical protein FA95DRAFT_400760 [Auriscalpium vulgare]|uniref:Uncharacterized protein n=1 Tax=Auriscalpium vulgare TaxID=40419 RepID=A0ACB8RIT3_9AGAM|nr:hypothetical protein FA95DRAFT_400760 [Auriscalpium vulgare]
MTSDSPSAPAGSPSAPRLVAIPLPDNTNTSRSTSPGLGASETSAPLWPTGALSDLWSSNSRPSSPFSPDAFLILEDSPPTPPPSEGGNSPVSPGYEPLSPSRSWRRRLVDVPTDTFFTDNEGVEMNGFDLGDDSKHLYCRFPIKFTAYRILNTFLVSVFGMAKAILSYQGRRDAPTTLEWVLGVLVFVSMYWLGLCETAKPPVAPWFFHRDYATSTLCCLRRKRRRSKQVEGYQV